jgi:hypothetical protein
MEATMDKETIEHFLMPFTEEIPVLCRMPDGSLQEFCGIAYANRDGEGIVVLELPDNE